MSEYAYVSVQHDSRKKVWHLARNDWITLCGIPAKGTKEWQIHRWPKGVRPLGRLCKRCIKCREARER